MFLFFFDGATIKGRILTIAYAMFVVSTLFTKDPSISSKSHLFVSLYSILVNLSVITMMMAYTRQYIATWHGAEHKTIASYENNGSIEIEDIKKESRINDKCGGRLFLPLIVGMSSANFIAKKLGVNTAIVNLALMELVLWIDTLIGWDKIPITSQVSRWLQKHITTREPGEIELHTAQFAFQKLIDAHKKLDI
jgi:uncharacterized protein YqhQ